MAKSSDRVWPCWQFSSDDNGFDAGGGIEKIFEMSRTDSKANQDYSSIQRLRGKRMQQKPSHRNGTLSPDASKRPGHTIWRLRELKKMGNSGRPGFCSN
jgi:hypothetical protein